MSQGQGPPEDAGPPDHVRERFNRSKRSEGGSIEVSDARIEQLAEEINWENLSPFEEWVVAVLSREGLLDD